MEKFKASEHLGQKSMSKHKLWKKKWFRDQFLSLYSFITYFFKSLLNSSEKAQVHIVVDIC